MERKKKIQKTAHAAPPEQPGTPLLSAPLPPRARPAPLKHTHARTTCTEPRGLPAALSASAMAASAPQAALFSSGTASERRRPPQDGASGPPRSIAPFPPAVARALPPPLPPPPPSWRARGEAVAQRPEAPWRGGAAGALSFGSLTSSRPAGCARFRPSCSGFFGPALQRHL